MCNANRTYLGDLPSVTQYHKGLDGTHVLVVLDVPRDCVLNESLEPTHLHLMDWRGNYNVD